MPRGMNADEYGVALGTLVKVSRIGRTYTAVTPTGEDLASKIASYALKNAYRQGRALKLESTKNGATMWRQVNIVEYTLATRGINAQVNAEAVTSSMMISEDETPQQEIATFESDEDVIRFIQNSMTVKPKKLKIEPIWWKFAVRSVLRGRNLLVTGPSGCGKTLLAKSLQLALGRKFFYINLGATQDPRSTLIGNTHFSQDRGTFVSLSYFANAIQVPNALILLDEVTRAHPEAWNILMTVLDQTQKYLRVDEKADSQLIKVADGVSFLLTANIGSEYTATRTLDRALLDRCIMFEMQPLDREAELENLLELFPTVDGQTIKAIAEIAVKTRSEIKTDSPKVDTIVSTRMTEEWCGLIADGMTLAESAEVCVYPYFSSAGGTDSPRSFMRAVVQKYLETEFGNKTTPNQKVSPDDNSGALPWQ